MAKDLFNSLDLNLLRTFLIVYQEKKHQKGSGAFIRFSASSESSATETASSFFG